MGGCKHGPFLYEPVQRIRGFQKPLHLGLDFWKASLGRIGIHSQGEIPGFFHLCGTLSYRKGKGLGKSAPLKVRNLIQFRLGHIPPHIQQFPDALCGLLPGDEGGMQFLDRAPGGDANALRVIPDGVLLALDNKPRTVGAIAFLQEGGVVRLVLHIVGTDDFPAVPVIETHAQGFVNDLLGKLQLREKGLLRCFRYRKAAVQEGNLFLHAGQRRFFNYV